MASIRRYDVKQISSNEDGRNLTRYRQALAAEVADLYPDHKEKDRGKAKDSSVRLLSIRHSGVLDSLLFNSLEESCVDTFEELGFGESEHTANMSDLRISDDNDTDANSPCGSVGEILDTPSKTNALKDEEAVLSSENMDTHTNGHCKSQDAGK